MSIARIISNIGGGDEKVGGGCVGVGSGEVGDCTLGKSSPSNSFCDVHCERSYVGPTQHQHNDLHQN